MIEGQIQIEVPEDLLESWQHIVDIMAEIVEVPAALIMKLDEPYIEVFLSSNTQGNPYNRGDKEYLWGSGLYCETVLKKKDDLLVPDALADEKWKANPDIKLGMISYLGFPILLPDGKPFGTICVLDNKENPYSTTFKELISKFRDLVQSDIAIIYMNHVLGDKNKRLRDYLMELQVLRGVVTICSNCKSIRDNQDNWHPIEQYLIRHPEADFTHSICPKCIQELYPKLHDSS